MLWEAAVKSGEKGRAGLKGMFAAEKLGLSLTGRREALVLIGHFAVGRSKDSCSVQMSPRGRAT